jgi:hypothetical protein
MQLAERADITYPTDIGILERARLQTENIVDILYESIKDLCKKKPRTYRNKAHKDYLAITLKNNCNTSKET